MGVLGSYNYLAPPLPEGNVPISEYLLERCRLKFDMWEEYDSDSLMFVCIRMKTSPYDLEYQSEEELSRYVNIKYQRSCDLIVLISPGASSPWWSNAERRRQTRCL